MSQTQEKIDYQKRCAYLEARVDELQEQLRLALRHRFAPKSEKFLHPGMVPLFKDIDIPESTEPEEIEEKTEVKSYSRSNKRKPFPKDLPREEVYLDLPEAERKCSCCHQEMVKASEKFTEKLHLKPAEFVVKKYIKPLYSCKKCETAKSAKMPAHPIPKCSVTLETLANIAIQKYIDGMPLNRIEKSFQRYNAEIGRDKMSRWMITIAEMLKPIVDLMESKLFASKFMGIDETTIQVLKEQGRAAHQKSYFIVRANHKVAGEKITIFNYEKSRSSAVIAPYLSNFSGHLVSDGLSVYQSILMYKREIVHGGCWSHARRKFVEAIKGKKRGTKSVASDFIVLIDKLFKIEREIKDKPPDKVKQERTKKSKIIIQEINELLMDKLTAIPKKSLTGKGLHYLANQWDMLVRFLDHPELVIHNNYVEQQIRPFAVGRRAWLFADSTKGANASAIFYSLLVTAKNNGLNPYQYLCDVLSKIRFTTEFESLLPFKN